MHLEKTPEGIGTPGASNVHWLIATDNQIERGITADACEECSRKASLLRETVFRNSFVTDYFVMVKRAGSGSH